MRQFATKYKLPLVLLVSGLLTLLSVVFIVRYIHYNKSPEIQISEFNRMINQRYDLSKSLLNQIINEIDKPSFTELNRYSKKLPTGTALYLLKHDTLLFWSDNAIPFNHRIAHPRIIETPNGYFQAVVQNKDGYKYFLLDLIKFNYPYENEYLTSSFNTVYKIPADFTISKYKGTYKIVDAQGEVILYLSKTNEQAYSGSQELVIYLLLISAFILILLSLYLFLIRKAIGPVISISITGISAILLRIIQFKSGVPGFIEGFDFFSPVNYASSFWLPSLGDLFTNVLIITLLSFLLFRAFLRYYPTVSSGLGRVMSVVLGLSVLTFFYYLSLYLIDTLIINSSFELNLSRILDFSVYSLIAYLIIALILLNLFYITFLISRLLVHLVGKAILYISILTFSVLMWLIFHFTGLYTPQWQELVLFIIYITLLIAVVSKSIPFPHITTSTLLILTLTFISTFCLYHNKESKEMEERKLLSIRLSTEQDKVGEYLYSEMEKQLLSDSTLYKLFMSAWYDPEEEQTCINYLQNRYFNGYWTKYNAQITLCYPEKQLAVKPSNMIVGCNSYFKNIIDNITAKTSSKTLYYVKESYGANNYIARLPVYRPASGDTYASIIIEFTQKYVPKGLGYPELLLDKSFVNFYDMSIYSYAIYSDGELIKNVGDYSYSISEKPYLPYKTEYNFFDKNGYNHLYHIVNDKTSIIISKKNLSTLDKLAPFTYQLIFHIILVIILSTAFNLRYLSKKYLDLNSQLQLMLVALVLFSSMLIGAITLHNIRSLNDKKNQDMLSEKAHSVLIELEHKLDNFNSLGAEMEPNLQELLTKFSLVFFTDINLYTKQGDLLATSRPEIFEEGLRSEYMSSQAYAEIAINQRTFYVTTEQIGKYKYLSAYIPFRNKNNELMAYINLPYFAREHELRQEISSFLVTFVNIYIILTAFAVLIALLVGNYLTRPLKLIRDQFTHVKLDRKNEKITYNRRDELGNLINEYNLMLEKLEDSANKLAQSERESAWKEMARQIAHEIKNPLTPMKLSIQHLYKSWQDKAPDWESRLEKTTTSMIQQIDSLAAIASAFSDFAKFPSPKNANVEIIQIIKDTISLFVQQKEFSITFNHPQHECFVFADEKQLSRVMVNLINNAIQSIPSGKLGKIEITVEDTETYYKIKITDNGIGIPDEQKPKIFSPNFTTKSGGTGLGLALVKNIIDSAQGSISFSSDNSGTTFEILLPAIK